MNRFLKKLSLWLFPLLFLYLILGTFADGNTDDNYRHFTSKASSIILGDSRGSQAVIPYILDAKIKGKTFDNFALNITHSPYGLLYLKALKKKLIANTKDGVFILTVSPWNLSTEIQVKSEKELAEYQLSPFRNMNFYNLNPNYEYLIKNLNHSWFTIFRDRETLARSNTYLHKNGWLEVNIDMDAASLAKRTKEKLEFYEIVAKDQNLSSLRLKAFQDIIDFLKTKGTVYIVRIPSSEGMMKIENRYSPEFNQLMGNIANKNGISYFNFSENYNAYRYTDGNHMYKDSGKLFTTQIADSIISAQKGLK